MRFGSGTLVRIDQKVVSDDFNVQDRGRRWLGAAQIVIGGSFFIGRASRGRKSQRRTR